jgi:hypothetical protein
LSGFRSRIHLGSISICTSIAAVTILFAVHVYHKEKSKKLQEVNQMCPYLKSGQYCGLTDTYQDGYHFQEYCCSSDKWMKCANYESHRK